MTTASLTPPKMKAHFSSATMEWTTPRHVFDRLNEEFRFTLDPCCTHESAKCAKHYTQAEDGLAQDWSSDRVFMNPPYGRAIATWMRKAYEESQRGALVVCLVPARTDTAWWHDYAAKGEVRFLRGRLNFGGDRRRGHNAPFPVAIVILRGAPQTEKRPIPGTKEYDEETETMQEASAALRYYTYDRSPNQ